MVSFHVTPKDQVLDIYSMPQEPGSRLTVNILSNAECLVEGAGSCDNWMRNTILLEG